MRKVLLSIMLAAALWALPGRALAADPAAKAATPEPGPAAPVAQTTPGKPAPDAPAVQAAPAAPAPGAQAAPAKPGPSNPATDAAEARYRAWVDREHTQDAAVFAKEKAKIEDKYKGYVRPKRDKKKAAAPDQAPAKGN